MLCLFIPEKRVLFQDLKSFSNTINALCCQYIGDKNI